MKSSQAVRPRAGLFIILEPEEALMRALPRAWFYWRVADAASARAAVERFAVAGAVVSERHPAAAAVAAELASLGVPLVVLAESEAGAWRERGAVAVIPHPARVPDSAIALAERLEEMALTSWAEGVEA